MISNEKSFHYKSLKIFLHPEVYEPAEDTFLLLDSISVQANQQVLEIGAGTGIISLYCASKGANVVCSDINPYAIELIKKNFQENKHKIIGSFEVRQGNLFDIIQKNKTFDVIIFNPPYLPTTPQEKKGISQWYVYSFDGGSTGLKVTTQFLKEVKHFLTNPGNVYIIHSSLSEKQKLEQLLKKTDLMYHIVKTLRCDDEILSVYQISLKNRNVIV